MSAYQNRIVAFVDILGFREMVKQTVDSKDEGSKSKKKTQKKEETKKKNFLRLSRDEIGFTGDTKVTLFSDSIVISIDKANSYGVLAIFSTLKKLQIHLIRDQILLRGGIVHGKLIHDKDILLGPALISAYDLESSSALYPRIVIDPKVLQIYARREGEVMKNVRIKHFDYHKTFEKDFDGTYYIDYFSDVVNYLNSGSIEAYVKDVNSIVETNLKSTDVRIRMKYMWMKEKMKLGVGGSLSS